MFSDVPPALDFEGFFNSLKAARDRAAARGENASISAVSNGQSFQPGNIRLVHKSNTSQSGVKLINDTLEEDNDDEDTENILAPLMMTKRSPAQPGRRPMIPRWN